MLAQVCYDDSLDIWALGTILFELLNGNTPFYCFSEEELIRKIKDGRYKVTSRGEPISIETCLFLLECLQINEQDRIDLDSLLLSPFIDEKFSGGKLQELDLAAFKTELQVEKEKLEDCN